MATEAETRARSPPQLLAWIAWFLAAAAWLLLLIGVAGVQNNCSASSANLITAGGGAGYFAPTSCDKFYRYACEGRRGEGGVCV
jgi:hypothetical protein